jgi:hypothetical protein
VSAPTSRTGVSFHASPLLIGSGIAAVASTILMAVVWYFDARNPPPRPIPGSAQPPPPPPDHITLQVLLALCIVTWLAVLVAVGRDQLMRRINLATQEIIAATSEYGERRETEGYLKARRSEPPTPGGDVVPFPRQAPPPDPDYA